MAEGGGITELQMLEEDVKILKERQHKVFAHKKTRETSCLIFRRGQQQQQQQ